MGLYLQSAVALVGGSLLVTGFVGEGGGGMVATWHVIPVFWVQPVVIACPPTEPLLWELLGF